MAEFILETIGLTKKYRSFTAVQDINIHAPWRKQGDQLKYSDSERDAYQLGFIHGVAEAKEEAKKIVQNTRQE